jgi:hypothetical protein
MGRYNTKDRNTKETRQPKAPQLIAYHVAERGEDKSFLTRVGAAWDHDDGKGRSILSPRTAAASFSGSPRKPQSRTRASDATGPHTQKRGPSLIRNSAPISAPSTTALPDEKREYRQGRYSSNSENPPYALRRGLRVLLIKRRQRPAFAVTGDQHGVAGFEA